jgi:hypothetical protein
MRRFSIVAALVFNLAAASAFGAEPVVALWYRGTPPGTPRLDDLAAIKAAGFEAITWPSGDARAVADLSKLAQTVGLLLVIHPDGATASGLDGRLTIDATRHRANEIPAVAWRAVANGVRTISVDPGPGPGTGLDRPDGQRPDWVATAVALSRQLSANAELVDGLRRAPPPRFLSSKPQELDVQLFEGVRAWVIIATSTGRRDVEAEVALPKGVPYAIWVSLLDATTIAMVDRPEGARWKFRLDAGAAAVYVIDKGLK